MVVECIIYTSRRHFQQHCMSFKIGTRSLLSTECVFLFLLFSMFPTLALAVEGACNRMSTSDKVFSFTLSTARYKALPQPCAGTLDAPRICASITTSRSPLCLACRASLDGSGELYTFDPKSNINQFPGCRKVRANCMVT